MIYRPRIARTFPLNRNVLQRQSIGKTSLVTWCPLHIVSIYCLPFLNNDCVSLLYYFKTFLYCTYICSDVCVKNVTHMYWVLKFVVEFINEHTNLAETVFLFVCFSICILYCH